jgi:hypothetical protein
MTLTQEQLRDLLHYDPETGIFRRIKIVAPQSRVCIGDVAGCNDGHGYIRIKIGGNAGRAYGAHRLAWLYMTGEWPKCEIDHIDLNPSNNRWSNLREANRSTNIANTRKRSDNRSGVKGVYWNEEGRKWRAEINAHKRRIFLGAFSSLDEAKAAYEAAALEHYGEFARFA